MLRLPVPVCHCCLQLKCASDITTLSPSCFFNILKKGHSLKLRREFGNRSDSEIKTSSEYNRGSLKSHNWTGRGGGAREGTTDGGGRRRRRPVVPAGRRADERNNVHFERENSARGVGAAQRADGRRSERETRRKEEARKTAMLSRYDNIISQQRRACQRQK